MWQNELHLKDRGLERFGALSETILSCTRFDDVEPLLLRPLAKALQAQSSVFLHFRVLGESISLLRHHYCGSHFDTSLAYGRDELFRFDLFVSDMFEVIDGLSVPRKAHARIVQAAHVEGSEYYRQILKPFGVGSAVALVVPISTNRALDVICLGFHRARDAAPFSAVEFEAFSQVRSISATVLANLVYRAELDIAGFAAEAMCQTAKMSTVVLNERFMPIGGSGPLNPNSIMASLEHMDGRRQGLPELCDRLHEL